MAEQADAPVSKTGPPQGGWGFDPPSRHQCRFSSGTSGGRPLRQSVAPPLRATLFSSRTGLADAKRWSSAVWRGWRQQEEMGQAPLGRAHLCLAVGDVDGAVAALEDAVMAI